MSGPASEVELDRIFLHGNGLVLEDGVFVDGNEEGSTGAHRVVDVCFERQQGVKFVCWKVGKMDSKAQTSQTRCIWVGLNAYADASSGLMRSFFRYVRKVGCGGRGEEIDQLNERDFSSVLCGKFCRWVDWLDEVFPVGASQSVKGRLEDRVFGLSVSGFEVVENRSSVSNRARVC